MILPSSISDWPILYREAFEERAGLMEFLGNLSKEDAEYFAEQNIRKEAEEVTA